jgi:hypothetical protein
VATQWQLSSPRGLEGCNSQVPGDLRVATRVVKTQTSIIRARESLSFCRFRTIHCVCSVVRIGSRRPGLLCQVTGGLTVATPWQLSSPRGLESCNSQVPGDLRVAARVVKTQTGTIRIHGSLSFCRFGTFPYVFLWFALGFDDPGCCYQVLGGLTVATRWQLTSPRGLLRVATLKSPGT